MNGAHPPTQSEAPTVAAFEVHFSDLITGDIASAEEAVCRFCVLHGIPRNLENPRSFHVRNVDSGAEETIEY